MFEIIGIIFGGASRLFQFWQESRDKQAERDHEYRMFEQQAKLQEQKAVADRELRAMDIGAQADLADLTALTSAINAQAEEAKSAGGWVASLSASVRPIISYWLLFIYSAAKLAAIVVSFQMGNDLATIAKTIYTEFDGALLGSIVSFWFADRSLKKMGRS